MPRNPWRRLPFFHLRHAAPCELIVGEPGKGKTAGVPVNDDLLRRSGALGGGKAPSPEAVEAWWAEHEVGGKVDDLGIDDHGEES